MAEEIAGGKSEPELTKLIETVIKKVDGLAVDVRTNSFKLDQLESRFDRQETKIDRVEGDLKDLSSNVRTLSGQFNDVGVMAIKDHQRIDTLEERVGNLEEGVH